MQRPAEMKDACNKLYSLNMIIFVFTFGQNRLSLHLLLDLYLIAGTDQLLTIKHRIMYRPTAAYNTIANRQAIYTCLCHLEVK